VTYDATTGTARVGGGNRWSAVLEALQPYNVTVVGGRIGHVGVGGYLVGGK
jgi:FAD/FMN-containing dehydrogenase